MLERLKARKAEIARLREERGATDPILIIAGIAITLILLVGGSFAVSGFIGNAHNLNAKGDLDRVATAQAAYLAENDRYGALAVGPSLGAQNTELADSSIGFTPTDGNNVKVRTSANGWTAVTKSGSGDVFVRTSQSSEIFQLGSETALGDPVVAGTNIFRNSGAASTTDLQAPTVNGATVGTTGVSPSTWAPSGSVFRTTLTGTGSTTDRQVAMQARIFNSFNNADDDLIGQTVTMTAQLRSASPFRLHSVVPVASSGSTLAGSASTAPQIVPANTTITAFITFRIEASQYGSATRINFFAGDLAVGQVVEMSSIDLYQGEYDPSRAWFNGSTASSASNLYSWSGAANNSAAVHSVRPVITAQPTGLVLPAGITWSQVGADIAEVS